MTKLLRYFSTVAAVFGLSVFLITTAYATSFSPAIKVLQNFNQTVTTIKQGSSIPFLFPARVPVKNSTDKYYVNGSVFPSNKGFNVNVDSTADCNGAKYCNIGSITANVGGKPQMYSAMNGPVLTKKVKLFNDQEGYFTPAHAGADYWPTMMEFQVNNVLYQVTWKLDPSNEKQDMIEIVNSMLKTGAY